MHHTSSTLDFFSVTSTTSPNSENNTRNDASVTRQATLKFYEDSAESSSTGGQLIQEDGRSMGLPTLHIIYLSQERQLT
jgi:chaperone required for assembly of F1-ATPase